ncbi:MAG: polysaccharide biosynthesis protein [Gammaproteobacteria bacterium]|nr:polysaccharide biosynthesis protein [Gammaproteobacteria bacterium]MBV9619578.1 polysaccharide biosynthesis protein [Gammaproteobacteria bacterium]
MDAVAIPTALWAALALKFDRLDPALERTFAYFLVAVASAIFFFAIFGLYRAVIRFMGPRAMVTVIAGVSFSVFVLAAFDRFLASSQLPLTALGIYWALALPYVGGSRFVARYLFQHSINGRPALRVAIYGAGDLGARACAVLLGGSEFQPVVFIDDKKSLQGSSINGVRVYGSESLPQLVRRQRIDRILLAMPAATRRRRREILTQLEPLGVHVQSLPNLADLISGKAQINELCDVDVSDLLGRDPVPPKPKLFGSCIRGKVVLVTGAGGSIGSELCRQIIRLAPSRLVLFEMSELALYNIERELEEVAAHERLKVEIVPLLGNAHHRHRVREVLSTFGVQTVYHAAAYKHVPIVEHNVVEGIHNNVISTWYTAEAALETGVETFVLISTDKAVNPANVMGATKRLAELVLQALQERTTHTRFCMVRFGNVLASSGSVVPLFQEQIRRGGPITVTHPDVIRYFMTIPEAAQLVVQAGSMAKGGDVFVLDMGRPVRIDDLARRLVNLMGLTVRDANNPEGDIEIEYTGLRTAEKLFEELLIGTNVTGTDHPMIMRAMEHRLAWPRMEQILNELLVALASFDCHRALALLGDAVAEYGADVDIRDYVWTRKAVLPHAPAAKVADFAAKRRLQEAGKPTQGQTPIA